MIQFEEMSIKDGFVTIYDEDGLITIQMEKKYVEEIMNSFNEFVQKELHMVFEFDIDSNSKYKNILKLVLTNFGDYFGITGRLYGSDIRNCGYYFHDFEITECDIETWNEIYNFIKK